MITHFKSTRKGEMARHLNYFCKFAPLRSLMPAARRKIHNDTFVSCESLKKSGQFFRLGQSMAHSACGIVSKEHIHGWGEPAVLGAVQSLLRDTGEPHLSFARQSDTNYTHTNPQEGICILLLGPRFAVDGATGASFAPSRPVVASVWRSYDGSLLKDLPTGQPYAGAASKSAFLNRSFLPSRLLSCHTNPDGPD